MKSSLLLPLKYILTTVILLVLFTVFKLFPLWGASFSPETGMTYGYTRELLPFLINQVFLIAATLAAFLAYMGKPLERRGKFIKFILMGCALFFILSVGFSLTNRYTPEKAPFRAQPVLLEETIHHLAPSYIYPQRVKDSSLSGVVVFDKTAQAAEETESGFFYYREGRVDSDTGDIILSGREEHPAMEPSNPVFSPIFATPNYLAAFADDAAFFTSKLQSLKNESQNSFLFHCFVIALFCASCGTVARITRWPVFNILGLLLMFRALFYLYRVFSEDSGTELAAFISGRFGSAQLPVIILLFIAGILVIWDILFVHPPREKGSRRYG